MWMNNGQNNKKNKSDLSGNRINDNVISQNFEIRVKLVRTIETTKVELVRNYSVNI